MAGLTLTNADKVLKEFYIGPVREQLNNQVKFLAQLEKNEKSISGKRAYVPIHVSRNSGIGARADGGTLPTAGNQGYEDSLVPLMHQYGRIKVTGPTIRATRNDEGAFIRAVSSEMKGVVNDLRRDINRQSFGTSNGVKATCGTTTTAVIIVLAASTTVTQMRQFDVGEVVDIGTVADPVSVASARTIVSIDIAARTITVNGSNVSTTGTDFVFRSGNGGDVANSSQKEITGLRTIVDSTGTLHDVNPSTYPVWSAYEDSASSNRILTEDLIQEVADNVETLSGHIPPLWIGSKGVVRSFGNQLSAQKRFVNTVQLKAGWGGIELAAAEGVFAKDRDCPENTAFAVNPEFIVEYQMSDYDWADYDGRALRNVAGEDAWEAFLYKDHEIATSQRNAHAKVTELTE